MTNSLTRKLEGFADLTEEDRHLLDEVVRDARSVPARTDLIREGDKPSVVHLILDGFACRYKLTAEGKRQIMAYLVPGDFCNLQVFVLKQMDHTIATLSPCRVVRMPREHVLRMQDRPALARALWFSALTDLAVTREWLLSLGQRPADQRIAHVLSELRLRLRVVGLADGGGFELPITQTELADTMGLSTVHVNRVLQKLRQDNLITLKGGQLVILDGERLDALSGFNPNYLHLLDPDDRKASH